MSTESQNTPTALVIFQGQNFKQTSEGKAVATWAKTSTNKELLRARDIERDKLRDVSEFFEFCQKPIEEVTSTDVLTWLNYLQNDKPIRRGGKEIVGLKPMSIATKLAHLSSFFEWLMKSKLGDYLKINPARVARPKQPKAYSSESAESLDDEQLVRLWQVIADAAQERSDVLALRDYAIFRLFMATGMRRSEILNLTGEDVQLYKEGLLIRALVKGGDYTKREIADQETKQAVLDYLEATNRINVLGKPKPLWLRHDRASKREVQISSHAFAERMKRYAERAEIKNFHLHQLRHTYARIVSEESGSIIETQDALGHKNAATTRVYVQRIGIKKDKFSEHIKRRILPK